MPKYMENKNMARSMEKIIDNSYSEKGDTKKC